MAHKHTLEVTKYTDRSGEVALGSLGAFRFLIQGTSVPEVYGWIEKDHTITHQGGFWRTPDPLEAAERALAAFGLEVR
ncbi:hypothetical protein [Sphingomonas desiccabilis]|uniref:Uncharacterized protein n=1 Tax=Sphingomonas desiccabilis TaxID=429134 RepID=A0A4Q2IZZ5_9SPHN|nr:hypothetical protein [Sphingomonas desiccabilis]MBB3910146.1 hypothetical protein [Sphingomonas desiccabilis]RXZ34824.1 hypothetical protein EO081_03970 [Sphingomonas desiccabilis]